MPADTLAWLVDHFSRFNGGSDPVLTTRFLQCLRKEAERREMFPAELLLLIERHAQSALTHIPDAAVMKDSVSDV